MTPFTFAHAADFIYPDPHSSRAPVIKPLSAVLLLLCLAVPSFGQTSTNTTGWYQYVGDHPISGHWGIHAEGQWRRDHAITDWEQLLLRSGVNYQVNKHFTITLGQAYLRTFAYGEISGDPTREHRIYQDLNVKHSLGRIDWIQRFRLEQRFIAQEKDYNWGFAQRVRYQLQARIPLSAPRVEAGRFYLSLYDEFFFKFGAHGGPQAFNQNRAYAALGINLKGKNQLEAGYLYRYSPRANGIVQQEHSLQVSIFSTSRLFHRP